MTLTRPAVTGAQVTECLAGLGVKRGDALIFHCALSSIGRLEGGAEALIEAFLAAVGPEGTLMAPVMPDMFAPIDLLDSPSTLGRVAEALRLWPGALRSMHPTHSVAALGQSADRLVAGHEDCTPCGPGSPYEKLAQLGGWVLLFGVDQDRNTSLHTAEDLADMPYLREVQVEVRTPDGRGRKVRVPKFPQGHREFIGIDPLLRRDGLVRIGQVGNAVVRLMPARELLEWAVRLLRRDPMAFLCRKPRCVSCRWAEARVRAARGEPVEPVDWDARSRRWGCEDVRCEVCYV